MLQAWFIAGLFVLLALPVSIYEVAMQLEYFSRPKLQIRVIRILWMVPVYALDSWFALRFKVKHFPAACSMPCGQVHRRSSHEQLDQVARNGPVCIARHDCLLCHERHLVPGALQQCCSLGRSKRKSTWTQRGNAMRRL